MAPAAELCYASCRGKDVREYKGSEDGVGYVVRVTQQRAEASLSPRKKTGSILEGAVTHIIRTERIIIFVISASPSFRAGR